MERWLEKCETLVDSVKQVQEDTAELLLIEIMAYLPSDYHDIGGTPQEHLNDFISRYENMGGVQIFDTLNDSPELLLSEIMIAIMYPNRYETIDGFPTSDCLLPWIERYEVMDVSHRDDIDALLSLFLGNPADFFIGATDDDWVEYDAETNGIYMTHYENAY